MNDEKDEIPIAILKQLYEYSGGIGDEYKGYILSVCNSSGEIDVYHEGNEIVIEGLSNYLRKFLKSKELCSLECSIEESE